MNKRVRQYLFGAIFAAVGVYYVLKNDHLEGSLYILAGLAFEVNSLVNEPVLAAYKKIVTIIAWGLIIATGILFLWVIQFKYL
jgi:drug/metabolite transporter (DMT)-like permease